MEKKSSVDLFGASVLIAFSTLLGLNQVMVKLVNAGFSPVFQAGLRSLCAIPFVFILALIAKKKLSVSDGTLWAGLLSGIFFAAEFLLLFQALEFTTVARSSIFFYTMPFWVAVSAHFLIPGEKLTAVRIGGLLLALGGIVLALSNNQAPATENALLGDLMCLFAATLWAGIALLVRLSKLSSATPQMQLIYQLVVSAFVLLPIAAYLGDPVRQITPNLLGIFAFQVVGVVSIGFLVWFWVLSIYPASDMASFGFLAPVAGVFFGWLILGEEIDASFIAALCMVAAGIFLVNRRKVG